MPSNLFIPKARAVSRVSAVSRTRFPGGLNSAKSVPCHLSVIFMDRISKCSHGGEGLQFGEFLQMM